VGNVGAGIFAEPDSNGNNVSIVGILSLIATLKEAYQANASFLMARPTSIVLRKAQMMSNLFFQAFTSVGGQDYLFGYPVNYSSSMPAAIRGNAPVVFGDFKRGYLIGDRGGSGINVKVLDQPLASQGLLQLLAYRRTDGRVRRPEALQQYNISAS
jgi:HK97 family phage major capsid protein